MRRGTSSIGALAVLASLILSTGTARGDQRARPADLVNFVGSATQLSSGILLVPAGRIGAVGAVYTRDRLTVASGFSVRFSFSLSTPTGECLADGMAFVIQDEGPSAVGANGGNLGFGRQFPFGRGVDGITRSLAVEVDVWANGAREFGPDGKRDPRVPHVSLQTRGPRQNDANPRYSLASGFAPSVGDGAAHVMRVHYLRRGRLDVFLDGNRLLRHRLDLVSTLGLADGRAYLGFTASTGLCTEDALLGDVKILDMAVRLP